MNNLQRESVKKYDTMIAFAETQKTTEYPDSDFMLSEIGCDWYADTCPYCQKYGHMFFNKCKCPLSNNSSRSEVCCDGLWSKMRYSETWEMWLKYARLVRQYIIDNG